MLVDRRRMGKTFALFLILIQCMTATPGLANTHPCLQEPTARCLIRHAIDRLSAMEADDPLREELLQQTAFESKLFGLTFPINSEGNTNPSTLNNQLMREEQLLQTLQQKKWSAIEPQLNAVSLPLQDFLHPSAPALYLEALALALQDDEADLFKKKYYASLMHLTHDTRTERMLMVARHEMLGGQPDKGFNTLNNTDLDEFSASQDVMVRRSLELLAKRSRRLFLQPDQNTLMCDNPNQLARAMHAYLADDDLRNLFTSPLFPDTQSRIEVLLLLARLHHNSASCPLLENWLRAQAILLSIQSYDESARSVLSQVYIARAIRRYLPSPINE